MGEYQEKIIDKTINDVLTFQPKFVAAGHCTGYKAKAALRSAFGDNFNNTPTGSRFRFPTKN